MAKKNNSQPARRELIVIARTDVGLRAAPATKEKVASSAGADVTSLSELLKTEKATLQPLFGLSEERMLERTSSLAAATGADVPDLSNYYSVEADDDRLDDLAESLRQLDTVEAAYVKPPGEPPKVLEEEVETLNEIRPDPEEPPVATPNFTPRQIFLSAAPAGIDALYAWGIPGGRGAGVKIIDCEWGWNFTHEDHLQNSMGTVVGTSMFYTSNPTDNNTSNRCVNHGTAVIGIIGGDRNTFGITGICPDASVAGAAFGNSAQTIRQAADRLQSGDIILLEIHRAGPRFNFQARQDQRGYIAIEWWPDDFAAILYATSKGIIVVEAAGNGAENLDDALYDTRPAGFPVIWKNPFNTSNPSSSAVLVGAGAPPPGTHGRDHGPDRSRLDFSNYGARVDCQGWGREVTTTGYGDLQGGSAIHTNEWYTDRFSGTSSASPIVVGALGCVQGVLRAQRATPLNPKQAISFLRSTGSPQQDAVGRPKTQRIGNRPDLRQLIPAAIPARRWHNWESLGGTIIGAPAAASWAPNRLDCFARGTNNHMYHKWWNGSRWSAWEDLRGVIVGSPAAVSWGPNRIDCFAPGTNNQMYHKWWDGSAWRGWESLGGTIIGAPAVASWAPNRLDCFVRGTNNHMYHKWWNGSRWSNWEDLGGVIVGAPAAVSWGANRIDCFAPGTNNQMYHKWWDGSAWRGWESLGGTIIGAPAVASWAPNRLDCFVRGTNNHMYHKWWNGSRWSNWEDLGGVIVAPPAAVSWGAHRIDCFATGTNNQMYHKSYS